MFEKSKLKLRKVQELGARSVLLGSTLSSFLRHQGSADLGEHASPAAEAEEKPTNKFSENHQQACRRILPAMRTHAHAHPEAVSNPVTAAHAEAAALVLLERRQEHHALKQATPQHAAEGADLVAVPRAAHGGGAAGALRLEAVRETVTAKAKATAEEATAVVQAPERTHHPKVTACAVRRRVPHALRGLEQI